MIAPKIPIIGEILYVHDQTYGSNGSRVISVSGIDTPRNGDNKITEENEKTENMPLNTNIEILDRSFILEPINMVTIFSDKKPGKKNKMNPRASIKSGKLGISIILPKTMT